MVSILSNEVDVSRLHADLAFSSPREVYLQFRSGGLSSYHEPCNYF